jgi:rSAM/selenodomain-associated transferase 1
MMKYPEAGKVKSRLAESIGAEAAVNLYQTFIQDTLTTVRSLNIPFHLAVYPPESLEQLTQWLGPSYRYFPQQGTNLGERLQNGFAMMFKQQYHQVIALASDCPDLPAEILRTALSTLQTHKVVIGPATDGGYYLIGFSSEFPFANVFHDVSWGTATVFQETFEKIEAEPAQIHVLPEWPDIDTKEALQEFYKTHEVKPSQALHTMNYLRSHPEILSILFP